MSVVTGRVEPSIVVVLHPEDRLLISEDGLPERDIRGDSPVVLWESRGEYVLIPPEVLRNAMRECNQWELRRTQKQAPPKLLASIHWNQCTPIGVKAARLLRALRQKREQLGQADATADARPEANAKSDPHQA